MVHNSVGSSTPPGARLSPRAACRSWTSLGAFAAITALGRAAPSGATTPTSTDPRQPPAAIGPRVPEPHKRMSHRARRKRRRGAASYLSRAIPQDVARQPTRGVALGRPQGVSFPRRPRPTVDGRRTSTAASRTRGANVPEVHNAGKPLPRPGASGASDRPGGVSAERAGQKAPPTLWVSILDLGSRWSAEGRTAGTAYGLMRAADLRRKDRGGSNACPAALLLMTAPDYHARRHRSPMP